MKFSIKNLRRLLRAGTAVELLADKFEQHIHDAGQVGTKVNTLLEINHQTQMQLADQRREIESLRLAINSLRSELMSITADAKLAATHENGDEGDLSAALHEYYWQFEEHFRGTRDQIRGRLQIYRTHVDQLLKIDGAATVVDLGCGRGEWLELVKSWGADAVGVDSNSRMIAECESRGLKVVSGDAVAYLRTLHNASVGAVTGFHIVEHLPLNVLFQLFNEAYRVVRPGGFVLFETPNPENLIVGSCNFYTDPTHRNPIPPHSLAFLLSYSGFKRHDCLRLGTKETSAKDLSDELAMLVERINLGPDYAIIGYKDRLDL